MSNCSNCCNHGIFPYRVVQTIYERNTIPCPERLNGMIVTVVGDDLSYKQYMLKGGDPCVNSNWVLHNDISEIVNRIGNVTLEDFGETPVTYGALNNMFPEAEEGFKVTILSLNTTFMKIFNHKWVMSNNNTIINE